MKWQEALSKVSKEVGEPLLDALATELYERVQSVDVRKPGVAKKAVQGFLGGLFDGARSPDKTFAEKEES